MLVFAQIYRSISNLRRKTTVAWSRFDFYLTQAGAECNFLSCIKNNNLNFIFFLSNCDTDNKKLALFCSSISIALKKCLSGIFHCNTFTFAFVLALRLLSFNEPFVV